MSKRTRFAYFLAGLLTAYLISNMHVYGLGGAYNNGAYIEFRPLTRNLIGQDLAGNTYSYHPYRFCGIEWKGTPGAFCDVDY